MTVARNTRSISAVGRNAYESDVDVSERIATLLRPPSLREGVFYRFWGNMNPFRQGNFLCSGLAWRPGKVRKRPYPCLHIFMDHENQSFGKHALGDCYRHILRHISAACYRVTFFSEGGITPRRATVKALQLLKRPCTASPFLLDQRA